MTDGCLGAVAGSKGSAAPFRRGSHRSGEQCYKMSEIILWGKRIGLGAFSKRYLVIFTMPLIPNTAGGS